MTEAFEAAEHWHFDDRYYAITAFSDIAGRNGFGWELEDVAPAPARGLVAEAFWDASTGEFAFWARTDQPLPFGLVHQFVCEAASHVPPTVDGEA